MQIDFVNGVRMFQVMAIKGNSYLGGEDFDNNVVNHFVEEFERLHEVNLKQFPSALNRLRKECTNAKHALTSSLKAHVEIDALYNGIDFYTSITRQKFEELNNGHFQKTMKLVDEVIKDAKLNKCEIDDVVLIGGSTRIPKLHELLENFFEKKVTVTLNQDEAGKISMYKYIILPCDRVGTCNLESFIVKKKIK